MIGIASVYYQHNYGSMLQAYATQEALDKQGIANETICIAQIGKTIQKRKMCYFAKACLTSSFFKNKKGMLFCKLRKKNPFSDFGKKSRIRDAKFKEFQDSMFRYSVPCDSFAKLTEYTADKYTSVVVGSDQLWLPGNIAGDYFTLNFVPEGVKRVSYATSFGQANLPKKVKEKAHRFLSKIDALSVRDNSSKSLIYDILGTEAKVVCDPVILLEVEEWDAIQKPERIIADKYILCYFLGNNPKQREFCQKLRKQTGYRLVGLLHLDEYVKADEYYVDDALYDIGPKEFLNLLKHAEYVCTDSFHASVFSIMYHKQFFTFRRFAQNTKQSTNGRIDSLFEQMHIERPILLGEENPENIMSITLDYASVDRYMNELREDSLQFLLEAVK